MGAAPIKSGWIGQDFNNTYRSFLPNGYVGIGNDIPN